MALKNKINKPLNLIVACGSFAISALAFLVAVIELIRLEGPGSPDLSVTLSEVSARNEFTFMLFIFAIAIVLSLVGMTYLYILMKATQPYAMLLVLLLNLLAGAVFMCLLTFHYTLIALVGEGLDTSSNEFHFFSVLAHSAGDFSGWISIGLWGISTTIIASVLSIRSEWKLIRFATWVFFLILIVLYIASASYAYLILFALWELLISLCLFRSKSNIN